MGSILNRALEQAGLGDLAARVLRGEGAPVADLARLRSADVLLLAGLADAVRSRFHGEDVRVLSAQAAAREPQLAWLGPEAQDSAKTGQESLVELAVLRLMTPGRQSVAASVDALGLQLAQVALSFGADVLFGDLGSARGLALLDGPAARRSELTGLIARAGRRARFEEPRPVLALESRS